MIEIVEIVTFLNTTFLLEFQTIKNSCWNLEQTFACQIFSFGIDICGTALVLHEGSDFFQTCWA